MSNDPASPTQSPATPSPGHECRPWCEFRARHAADHPAGYCSRTAGACVRGYTPGDEEVELDVVIASARGFAPEWTHEACRRHASCVQLDAMLPGDTLVVLDFDPGAARRLAAILTHAADVLDGVATR